MKLQKIIDYLIQNKEWIFDGIGIFIVGLIIRWLFSRKKSNDAIKQRLKSGNHSNPLQAGRDINIFMTPSLVTQQNTIKSTISAIESNLRIVDLLKEQYDRITKQTIDYMPKCFLELYFFKNLTAQQHETFASLPSSQEIYDMINSLFALEKALDVLKVTAERELTTLREKRIYQQNIIIRCKEQLNISKDSLLRAKDALRKVSLP